MDSFSLEVSVVLAFSFKDAFILSHSPLLWAVGQAVNTTLAFYHLIKLWQIWLKVDESGETETK